MARRICLLPAGLLGLLCQLLCVRGGSALAINADVHHVADAGAALGASADKANASDASDARERRQQVRCADMYSDECQRSCECTWSDDSYSYTRCAPRSPGKLGVARRCPALPCP